MGACVSLSRSGSSAGSGAPSSAHVISLNGDLIEFPVPVTVSEVLEKQEFEPKSEPCFLCNSDRLNFDEFISPLKKDYQLQAGQIYFMLHESKLHYKLSASDMAALAVKASVALQTTPATSSSFSSSSALTMSCCSRRMKNKNNRKARISPIMIDLQQEDELMENDKSKIGGFSDMNNEKSYGRGVSRSGSMRKLQRLSSKRAKLAVRSFRLKLSTIYEGTVLQSH